MLTQLSIQNFGLIERIVLECDDHLNILTGETGAGKSIVIEALRIALGERLVPAQVRDPKKPCVIEAVFDIQDKAIRKLDLFQDFWQEDDTSLIIQRILEPEGRSRIKINGLTVTINQLRAIGDHLIDFHGPHDHQMLLSASSHLGMLDRLSDIEKIFPEYQKLFAEYSDVQKKIAMLTELAQTREREVDLLTHQVKELSQVPLEEADYEKNLQDRTKITNAERLHGHIQQLLGLIEDENGSGERLRQGFAPLRALNHIDEKTLPWTDMLTQMQELNEQLLVEVREYAESLAFEPGEAEEINKRCDAYDDIKRKFGPTLEDAKRFYEEAKRKLDLLTDLEHNDAELKEQKKEIEKKLKASATKITKERQKTALSLKKTIEKELAELGIANVKFEARIEAAEFNQYGQDLVTFYISPNAGEALKPLAEIVSSGEAARVMLALKKALIKVDPIPVLIFDEIDAQIGGRLGTVIGEKLKQIASVRQVILITHLPQIASFADKHFKIKKIVKDGRALTTVDELTPEARVKELAQMMSGEKESEISRKHAQDLLAKAGK